MSNKKIRTSGGGSSLPASVISGVHSIVKEDNVNVAHLNLQDDNAVEANKIVSITDAIFKLSQKKRTTSVLNPKEKKRI